MYPAYSRDRYSSKTEFFSFAKPAINKPLMPALNAYAETISPNWRGVMAIDGIINAPNGDMIMKSRITENCRKASMPMIDFW